MKKFIIIIIGMLFIMVSCQKENLVKEEPQNINTEQVLQNCAQQLIDGNYGEFPLPAVIKSQGNQVTKHIVFHQSSGTISVIVNPEACGEFDPPLQMVVEGGGTATHIGKYTVLNIACVDSQGNFLTPIYGFITAANGDEIHTQLTEMYPDPENPGYMTSHYIIIGGTGRFENATGWVDMYGIIDFENGTWELSGEGEITY